MISTRILGHKAEEIAVKYLINNNYKILGRNYFKKCGEIDIIAWFKDSYIFVEVKSQSSESFKVLEMAITFTKFKRLYKTCLFWLYEHDKYNENWRIDSIGIYLVGGIIKRFKHIENISFESGR